jgi:hypothetical protein
MTKASDLRDKKTAEKLERATLESLVVAEEKSGPLTFAQILEELLALAEMIVSLAKKFGSPEIVARLDALIVKLSADLTTNASAMGITPGQLVEFQARLAAVKGHPEWKVKP